MTGLTGALAYWKAGRSPQGGRAFDQRGGFRKRHLCGFATLSAFAANGNHAPTGCDGAITHVAGLDLLFRIAGSR